MTGLFVFGTIDNRQRKAMEIAVMGIRDITEEQIKFVSQIKPISEELALWCHRKFICGFSIDEVKFILRKAVKAIEDK